MQYHQPSSPCCSASHDTRSSPDNLPGRENLRDVTEGIAVDRSKGLQVLSAIGDVCARAVTCLAGAERGRKAAVTTRQQVTGACPRPSDVPRRSDREGYAQSRKFRASRT